MCARMAEKSLRNYVEFVTVRNREGENCERFVFGVMKMICMRVSERRVSGIERHEISSICLPLFMAPKIDANRCSIYCRRYSGLCRPNTYVPTPDAHPLPRGISRCSRGLEVNPQHVMDKGKVRTGFWWGNLRETDHLEGTDVHGRLILKRIFKEKDGDA